MGKVYLLALSAAMSAIPLSAMTTYTKSFTNATSVSVTNAEHGFNLADLGVNILDSTGAAITGATITINSATYEVTVAFTSSKTGSVKVTGVIGPDTTDAWSAQVSGSTFTLCPGASLTSPQIQTYNLKKHVCAQEIVFTRSSSVTNGALRVFRDPSTYKIVFGISFASGGGTVAANPYAEVRNNVTSFPSGSIQLWQIGLPPGSTFAGVDLFDKRPW